MVTLIALNGRGCGVLDEKGNEVRKTYKCNTYIAIDKFEKYLHKNNIKYCDVYVEGAGRFI